MKTDTHMTIVEGVRSHKEALAAKFDFDVARMVADARKRQESSDRRIIRQGEPFDAGQGASLQETEPGGDDTAQTGTDGRSR